MKCSLMEKAIAMDYYVINKECEGELACVNEKMKDREMLNFDPLHN